MKTRKSTDPAGARSGHFTLRNETARIGRPSMAGVRSGRPSFASDCPQTPQLWRACEVGRDGFWLHPFLLKEGIQNIVVDSASWTVLLPRRGALTLRYKVRGLVVLVVAKKQQYTRKSMTSWDFP
jgi:hypothetical protein